jgi:hypothetical protein
MPKAEKSAKVVLERSAVILNRAGIPESCDPASNFDPRLEWAPWGGQSGELELTVEPGFRKKEAHGQAPYAQH